MPDKYLHLDAEFVKAELAKLFAAYPELADDESLKLDTIEGETNAMRVIERALAERQEAESLVGAIKVREADLAARRNRFERKSDAMKTLIRHVMKAAQLPKVILTEATLTVTKAKTSVGIEDLNELPQGFYHTNRVADRGAIRAAIESGETVPGAILVLGSEGLTIRPK